MLFSANSDTRGLSYLHKNSFTFGGVDMYDEYGICIIEKQIYLKPKLRDRKLVIPQRNGAYDYGAKYYDEKQIRLKCDTLAGLSPTQKRELAYTLSTKERIVFWDEQDKYYVGQIYDATSVDRIGLSGDAFTLIFECDPFAYGKLVTETWIESIHKPKYMGTQRAPTYITITNTSKTENVVGVTIRFRERR